MKVLLQFFRGGAVVDVADVDRFGIDFQLFLEREVERGRSAAAAPGTQLTVDLGLKLLQLGRFLLHLTDSGLDGLQFLDFNKIVINLKQSIILKKTDSLGAGGGH